MKRPYHIPVILAALIMAVATGCGKNGAGEKMPETEANKGGLIVTEEVVRPVCCGDFNWPLLSVTEERHILKYDPDDKIVSKESYRIDRKWLKKFGPLYKSAEVQYIYNDDGNLAKAMQQIFDNKGVLISEYETLFKYDTEGKKTGMIWHEIDGDYSSLVMSSEMTYNGDGRLHQKMMVIGSDTTYSTYIWKPDGTCLVNKTTGQERSSYLIDGESHNLLEIYAADGTVIEKLEYNDRDLIRETAGGRTSEYTYRRKYDKDGNCIRYSSYCDGRWMETIRRHIQEIED